MGRNGGGLVITRKVGERLRIQVPRHFVNQDIIEIDVQLIKSSQGSARLRIIADEQVQICRIHETNEVEQ